MEQCVAPSATRCWAILHQCTLTFCRMVMLPIASQSVYTCIELQCCAIESTNVHAEHEHGKNCIVSIRHLPSVGQS